MKRVITMFAVVLGIIATAGAINKTPETKKEVEKAKKSLVVPMIFEISVANPNDQDNPSEQMITQEGITDPNCGLPGSTICAAELDLDPNDPDVQELRSKIANNETVTVQDFLDIDNSLVPSYTHKP